MASIFGTASASASATLPEKATDVVGAAVSSVTGSSPPLLPSTVPPPPGPPPIAVPTVSQVPPEKAPSATNPSSSPVPVSSGGSDPGLHLPSPGEGTGGAKGPAAGSMEETDQAAPSARSGGGGLGSPDVQHAGVRAGKVESAKVAPLGLLRAYVWPAIALGSVGGLLGALPAGEELATLLAVPDASGLLTGLLGVAGVDRTGAPSKSTAVSNPPPRDSRVIPVPSGGQISLIFIILCTALMAWLVFALRREARSAHWHWPL